MPDLTKFGFSREIFKFQGNPLVGAAQIQDDRRTDGMVKRIATKSGYANASEITEEMFCLMYVTFLFNLHYIIQSC